LPLFLFKIYPISPLLLLLLLPLLLLFFFFFFFFLRLRRRHIFCFCLQVIAIDKDLFPKVTPDFFASLSSRSAQGLYRQLGKACPMPPLSSLSLEALTPILL
jgi:hypothetical protein